MEMRKVLVGVIVSAFGARVAVAAVPDLILPPNLAAMHCSAPDPHLQFIRGSQPGNIFFPEEAVDLTLKIDEPVKSVELRVQEISSGADQYIEGRMDMAPPVGIAVKGKEIVKTFAVTAGAGELECKDVPMPARFGCYAVTIAADGKAPAFLCTVIRGHKPIEGYSENGPIMGEAGQFFNGVKDVETLRRKAQTLARMGVKMVRFEMGPYHPPKLIDDYLKVLTEAKIKALITLGAHSPDVMPFHAPTPAISRADYTGMAKYDERFGKAVEEFCRAHWDNGNSAFWGFEHWNEPWEPSSISGYESDGVRYRALLKLMSNAAHGVDPRIKICAACSIMNTEDKLLTGEDRAEYMKLIDCMTDHYVVPRNAYGPMVAHHWGKRSFETETWGGASESLLAQFVVQFTAAGQSMINPWTADMVYYSVNGKQEERLLPTPTAFATNVLDYFLTNRPFKKMLFLKNLPFAFQYGEGDDAVVVLLGRLQPRLSFFGWDPKDVIWWQYNLKKGGKITIDNPDGALQFFDLAGNPEAEGQKSLTVPLDFLAHYIRSPKGGVEAIEKALAAAHIEGARPVEIIAHDMSKPVTADDAKIVVTLHNLLNRKIAGTLTFAPPAGLTLKSNGAAVTLEPGESKDISADIS
ncbi:MAG TPA: hypothetical protein VFC46_10510, partial [Humisphaera sp.]|nr:hypothetical protein [Humisphaera sp.]